jgi:hypothetical protein
VNIELRQLTKAFLAVNGYDGLYSDDCGCPYDDLMPCCAPSPTCQAGYASKCSGKGCTLTLIGAKKNDKNAKCEECA